MDPMLAVAIYLACGVSIAVLVGRAFRETGAADVTLDDLMQAYDEEIPAAHNYYAELAAAEPVIYDCEQHHSSVSAHRRRRERCGR